MKYAQSLCQRALVLGVSDSVWGTAVKPTLKRSSGQAGRLPRPGTWCVSVEWQYKEKKVEAPRKPFIYMSIYNFPERLVCSGMNVRAVGILGKCVALQIHPVLSWITGNFQIRNSIWEGETGYLIRHRNCELFFLGASQVNTI